MPPLGDYARVYPLAARRGGDGLGEHGLGKRDGCQRNAVRAQGVVGADLVHLGDGIGGELRHLVGQVGIDDGIEELTISHNRPLSPTLCSGRKVFYLQRGVTISSLTVSIL